MSFRKIFFVAFIFLSLSISSNAQNDSKAMDVLNNASAAYNKAGGIKAGFSLLEHRAGGKASNISGTILLKGSKFKIEVRGMIAWFDGKNEWVYIAKSKEVNLSNPTEEEMLMINPVNVFQLYKHGYTCKWGGVKKENGVTVQKVILTPAKRSSLQSIVASFDKSTLKPVRIIITNKDKSGSDISITSYLTGQNYSDSSFTFQQKRYPNVEVIDLR